MRVASKPKPPNGPRRARQAALVFGLLIFFIICSLVTLSLREEGFRVGATAVTLHFQIGKTQEDWVSYKKTEDHLREFASLAEFRMQAPGGVLSIRLDHDPAAKVRQRMPNSVPALARMLQSNDPVDVFCAAEAVGRKGAAAVPALPNLLSAAERGLNVSSAIETISLATPKAAAGPLTAALSSNDPDFQDYCANILGELGTNATPALRDLLEIFRAAAPPRQPFLAYVIWKISGDCSATLPALREILGTADDLELQDHVLYVLAGFGPQSAPAIPEIVEIVRSAPNSRMIGVGLEALGKIGEEADLVLSLIQSFLDKGPSGNKVSHRVARYSAIRALGGFGGRGIPLLISIYCGSNMPEAATAADTLARIGPPAAAFLKVFQADLSASDPSRVSMACDVIASFGAHAEPALPKLNELLDASNRTIKAHAAYALSKLGQDPAPILEAIIEILENEPVPPDSLPDFSSSARESELAFASLIHLIDKKPGIKSLLDQELEKNPTAARYVERQKGLRNRYSLPTYRLFSN